MRAQQIKLYSLIKTDEIKPSISIVTQNVTRLNFPI